ncbi:SdpI family protein [Gordonia sp. HY002]|uniref:SdpI family protein n=1 Tax=Gordonia zhenghanii TaxID=2911516 RepID=UPI001EF0AFCC|nr:SdpI family protein [Gordonia zhenghanii]MCF8571948.1 SdpI family protein [Gordonia zhenghanii]MCF8604166.1 SdpI family protein [Gordonia zhenghanii]
MHILSVVSAVLALVLAVFWVGVGVCGLTGRLERNRWVGVRSDETMRSADAFALGNKVAAPGFLAAALVLLIGGVLAFGGDLGFLFGFGAIVIGFAIAAVAAGVGVRVASTVPEPEEESGGCSADCCSGGDADDQAHDSCDTDDPAADCGASSCGSCALQGMCTTEHAADADQPVDAAR